MSKEDSLIPLEMPADVVVDIKFTGCKIVYKILYPMFISMIMH